MSRGNSAVESVLCRCLWQLSVDLRAIMKCGGVGGGGGGNQITETGTQTGCTRVNGECVCGRGMCVCVYVCVCVRMHICMSTWEKALVTPSGGK